MQEARDRFKHLTHIDRNRHYIRSSSPREEGEKERKKREYSAEFASPFITRIFVGGGSNWDENQVREKVQLKPIATLTIAKLDFRVV